LLEKLHSSVKIVSNSSISFSISTNNQNISPIAVPSQKIQVYSPKPIRSNNSFKAKSYFSLTDESKPQQTQNQKTNHTANVSMAATKIINLKRNSINLAHQGQLSIDALRTKTKEFITGKSLLICSRFKHFTFIAVF
jgi:hypothetical protein